MCVFMSNVKPQQQENQFAAGRRRVRESKSMKWTQTLRLYSGDSGRRPDRRGQ